MAGPAPAKPQTFQSVCGQLGRMNTEPVSVAAASASPMPPETVAQSVLQQRFATLREALNSEVIGQTALTERLLIALLADGHLLVEGAPGLARTPPARRWHFRSRPNSTASR